MDPGQVALNLQKCEKSAGITSIYSDQKILSNPKDIHSEFHSLYSNLYASGIPFDKVKYDNFPPSLWMSPLAELKDATTGIQRNKLLGWDGIRPEFYFTFFGIY